MKDNNEIVALIKDLKRRESDLKLDNEQLRHLNLALTIAEEKSAMLNSIIECSDDAIISKNLDSIITSWNGSAERIFGYVADEMIGTSILKLIPADREHEEAEILAQLRRGERIDHFETKRQRKDGTLVDVSLTISPILDSNGVIIGVSKIARDITEQRTAEVMGKRLSAIIESSDDAIISKDLNSIITSWNSAAARMFGYSADEMIGNSIFKIIPPDRVDEEPKILSQLKKGLRVHHFETVRMRKDGTLIDVSLTISPIKDRSGKVIGLSKIARDITEKKQIENKKDEFIGLVSHELKTPLTSLRSYIQVALHKAKQTQSSFISHALSKAEVQTKKMEKMITDFLNISRLQDGRMTLEQANFNLSTLIRSCAADAAITSSKHDMVFQGEETAYVYADEEKISLVLTNLISNAQKYSPRGSEITIRCDREDEFFSVSIQDQGIGIAEEDQKNMFQKFYRIRTEETRLIAGFGIGLHLVSSILELHGSAITVKSRPGEGSTFSFKLNAAISGSMEDIIV
ncbi:PAS domain-containing sensor histidine kinase [Pedobacter psychrodurus]|uniref:histidine kinase n=1 Tax=Pedobacter psychrodurus TaxID=2530456 RepID=A0A4R0PVC7_9SPHI|nr:PAS domain S-box protein [Pedobacter psychrodurus]TCD26548.1 PAS domain-containing sensor histidine kinase [Pedobacter psychrodurus]